MGIDVAAVEVLAPAGAVTVGKELQLTAEIRDEGGAVHTDRGVEWSSSDPSVAKVSSTGVVRGLKPGRVTITARAGGERGSVDLMVTEVASLTFVPPYQPLVAGKSYDIYVSVQDTAGRCLCETPVTWSVSDTLVARIVPNSRYNQSARMHVLRAGEFTVTVTVEGMRTDSTFTALHGDRVDLWHPHAPFDAEYVALGGSRKLPARVLDVQSAEIPGREITWTSSDPEVVSVDGEGVIRGLRPGLATITASAEGARSASTPVRVEQGYTAVALPLFPYDLNDHGQVVGTEHVPGQGNRPALWEDGRFLWGGPIATTISLVVNDSGHVAGTWTRGEGQRSRGFVRKGGEVLEIAPPDPAADLFVTDMNDRGQVVGYWRFPGTPTLGNAFVWEDGRLTDLGRFGGEHAQVNGINNRGQMAVTVWPQYEALLVENGNATKIATGKAEFINDHGDVIITQGANYLLWRDGVFTEFAPQRHSNYYLSEINTHGDLVGTYRNGPGYTAFVWREGRFRNPYQLTVNAPASGFNHGIAINERGQVLVRSHLLTPIP